METLADVPIMLFDSPHAWEQWLAERHAQTQGVWLKIAKKDADASSVSYAGALDAALCYGWIDGQKKSYDDTFWLQKFMSLCKPRTMSRAGYSISRSAITVRRGSETQTYCAPTRDQQLCAIVPGGRGHARHAPGRGHRRSHPGARASRHLCDLGRPCLHLHPEPLSPTSTLSGPRRTSHSIMLLWFSTTTRVMNGDIIRCGHACILASETALSSV